MNIYIFILNATLINHTYLTMMLIVLMSITTFMKLLYGAINMTENKILRLYLMN